MGAISIPNLNPEKNWPKIGRLLVENFYWLNASFEFFPAENSSTVTFTRFFTAWYFVRVRKKEQKSIFKSKSLLCSPLSICIINSVFSVNHEHFRWPLLIIIVSLIMLPWIGKLPEAITRGRFIFSSRIQSKLRTVFQ